MKANLSSPRNWICSVCHGSIGGLWACTTCWAPFCGREHFGHAEEHSNKCKHHAFYEMKTGQIYCYRCEVAEFPLLPHLRMQKIFGEIKTTLEENKLNGKCAEGKAQKHNERQALLKAFSIWTSSHQERQAERQWLQQRVKGFWLRWKAEYQKKQNTRAAAERPPIQKVPLRVKQPMKPIQAGTVLVSKSVLGRAKGSATHTTGLRNLGNTCFLNAVVQALMHITPFRDFFVNRVPMSILEEQSLAMWQKASQPAEEVSPRDPLDCFREACSQGRKSNDPAEMTLWRELHNLFRVLTSGKWSIVTPRSMVSALWHFLPCFKGCTQQDAQEFLFFLFDRLETELQPQAEAEGGGARLARKASQRDNAGRKSNEIRRLFEGRLVSKIVCQKCKALTVKEEPFLDVSLQIPKQHHCFLGPRRSTRHQAPVQQHIPSCSLEECFQSYARSELLPGVYMCENCKERTSAWKTLSFGSTPDILCIVLKRFAFDPKTCLSLKVDTHVSFPLSGLSLRPWMHCPLASRGAGAAPLCPPRITPSISRSLFGTGLHSPRAPCGPSPVDGGDGQSRSGGAQSPASATPDLDSDGDDLRPCKRPKAEGGGAPARAAATADYDSAGATMGPPGGEGSADGPGAGYHLRAVIVHHGKGLQMGHYTAYCWNAIKEQWIHFNDAELQPAVPPSEIRLSQAYILFYDRTVTTA
eukprot:EG_transcript_1801